MDISNYYSGNSRKSWGKVKFQNFWKPEKFKKVQFFYDSRISENLKKVEKVWDSRISENQIMLKKVEIFWDFRIYWKKAEIGHIYTEWRKFVLESDEWYKTLTKTAKLVVNGRLLSKSGFESLKCYEKTTN